MNPRDISLIARFEVARHLRSRHALVAGILLTIFCAVTSYNLADIADELAAASSEIGPALNMVTGAIQSVTGLPAVAIGGLLGKHPPVLVLLFGLVVTLMPLLCIILAYDQTATDIETRHVRYLLFRSDRDSIYLGKSLGALIVIAAATALILVVFGVFLALRSNALEGIEGVIYLGRIWLTVVFYSLPFVALLGLMSALVGRSRRTLSFTLLMWLAVAAISGMLYFANEDFAAQFRYLFPANSARFNLMLDSSGDARMTALYVLAYTLIAGGLGLWRFRTRDL